VGFSALALLLFYSAWQAPGSLAPGNAPDHAQFMWFLRWFPYAAGHLQDPLLTSRIDIPGGVNLMWNTSIPLLAAALSPVTMLAGPVAAYTVLITAAPAVNAWTAFLALRRLVPGMAGPTAGALLFGFSPFVVAQSLAHPQLTFLASAPLGLMALHSLVARNASPWRAGAALGVLAAGQLLVSEEVLVIEVVVAVLALALLAVFHAAQVKRTVPRLGRASAAAAVVFLVLAGAPLAVQFLGPQRPSGSPQPPSVFVTDAANLVLPTELQWAAPAVATDEYQRRIGRNLAEEGGYIGVPLLLLGAVVSVAWWRRPLIRWAGVCALVTTVLALGARLRVDGHAVGIPLPWGAFGALPLLGDVLPSRFMGLAFLFLAIVVGAAVQTLGSAVRGRTRGALATGLAAVVLSLLPALPYPATDWTVPAYFTDGSARRIPEDSVALVAPFPDGEATQAMLWQASAGLRFRMVGGYAYHPDAAGRFTLRPAPSATRSILHDVETGGAAQRTRVEVDAMARDLRAWDVRSIVVGPDDYHAQLVTVFTDLMRRPPDQVDGEVAAWYHVDASGAALPS